MLSIFRLFRLSRCVFVVVFGFSLTLSFFCPGNSFAQIQEIESPDRKFVFIEDQDKEKAKTLGTYNRRGEITERIQKLQARKDSNLPFGVSSGNITYDSATKIVSGKGGVILGYPTGILEANEAKFNTETGDAEIYGDIRIDDLAADIVADNALINLKTGKGSMENAKVSLSEGGYTFEASHVDKLEGDSFLFKDLNFSTCRCPRADDCMPWRITGTSGSITRDGYGQVWNGLWHMYELPLLYSPYVIFPVKTETQTGLLPPTFGGSKRKGFSLFLPFYIAMSSSMDATLAAVYQSKSRVGAQLDYQGLFSKRHILSFGGVFLDESVRHGDLLGTNIDGLYDPSIDKNRFGSYLSYYNKNYLLRMPMQIFADAHYASDDLLVREYSYSDIGDGNSRYLSSNYSLRLIPSDNWAAEALIETNQSLVTNDDFVFQKLPAFSLSGLERFQIFGLNPYGFKLITETRASRATYPRDKSYDGTKSEFYETWKVPFYYKNIFEGTVFSDVRASNYSLSEVDDIQEVISIDPSGNSTSVFNVVGTLPSSSDRVIPGFGAALSTVLERVYEVGGTSVQSVADLGRSARGETLTRVKHTIEPLIKYRFLPDVDQSDTPIFDAFDRLSETNVVTFRLMQRLFGRFDSRDQRLYGIEEASPTLDEAGFLENSGSVDRRFARGLRGNSGNIVSSSVVPRELVNFSVIQSFDFIEQQKDLNSSRGALSDLGLSATAIPNSHFQFGGGAGFSYENNDFSNIDMRARLVDRFNDELRTRLIFQRDLETQLETSVQINIVEWAKIGYYSRFDNNSRTFLESRLGLRFQGNCRCWVFDLDAHDRSNPEETLFNAKITFIGLGSFGNTIFAGEGMQFLNPYRPLTQ